MDTISSLPDSLLCHILSFLPTKDSVATSILSRNWRDYWKDLQVLDFDDLPFYKLVVDGKEGAKQAEERFVAFVYAVLAKHRNRHIQKFRLSCDVVNQEDAVKTWIHVVTGPCLQELYLNLSYYYNRCSDGFTLPYDGLFTCTSLLSLTLKDQIFLHSLKSVHLPSLKNLELDICFGDPDKLLSGCPVLETLKLHLYVGSLPAIHMPSSLKSLTFKEELVDFGIEHLEMITPSLQSLHITLRSCCHRTLISKTFPNMVEAHLDIFSCKGHDGWVPELLKALCRTKLLVLKVYTTQDQTLQYREPRGWTPPTSVPNCVISQLKIFEFRGYQDSTDEHAFTAFLLQRGLVLKTMTIHTKFLSTKKKYHILKELSTIPRGSTTCQLKVD